MRILAAGQQLATIPGVEKFERLRQVGAKNAFTFGFSMEFADRKAFKVCAGSGTPSVICAMKYAAEDDALTLAQSSLKACSEGTASHQAHHCPAVVAYIKQRWGY
jgi:N-acetylmuramic acid 6-phosphate (MurNAc-6-P) etherase